MLRLPSGFPCGWAPRLLFLQLIISVPLMVYQDIPVGDDISAQQPAPGVLLPFCNGSLGTAIVGISAVPNSPLQNLFRPPDFKRPTERGDEPPRDAAVFQVVVAMRVFQSGLYV
jgi:hypothetical protein